MELLVQTCVQIGFVKPVVDLLPPISLSHNGSCRSPSIQRGDDILKWTRRIFAEESKSD